MKKNLKKDYKIIVSSVHSLSEELALEIANLTGHRVVLVDDMKSVIDILNAPRPNKHTQLDK